MLMRLRIGIVNGSPVVMRAGVTAVTISQRVKRVRVALGKGRSESQQDFAKRFGVDQSTVSKWERGTQMPDSHHLDTLAQLEGEALDGDAVNPTSEGGTSPFTLVPVVGDIGAGATVYPVEGDRSSRATGYVRAPRGFGAVEALRVRGNSMWPAYRDGDTVFIDNKHAEFPLLRQKEYILELADGRVLLKMVEPNQDGTYNLISHNAPQEPAVVIKSARRVRYVRKD